MKTSFFQTEDCESSSCHALCLKHSVTNSTFCVCDGKKQWLNQKLVGVSDTRKMVKWEDQRFTYYCSLDDIAWQRYKTIGKDKFVWIQINRYKDLIYTHEWMQSYLDWRDRNLERSMQVMDWSQNNVSRTLNFESGKFSGDHCILYKLVSHNCRVSRGIDVWKTNKARTINAIDKCVEKIDDMKHDSAMLDLTNCKTMLS